MPQLSLFGGWAITDLHVHVHLDPGIAGGQISARVLDENGKQVEAHRVLWRSPRDVSDLPQVLKEVGNAFMWGEQFDVSKMLTSATRVHLPRVPNLGD